MSIDGNNRNPPRTPRPNSLGRCFNCNRQLTHKHRSSFDQCRRCRKTTKPTNQKGNQQKCHP